MAIHEIHVHSDASVNDGEQTVEDIVEYAKKNNISIALTEHGNMVSSYKFYNKCKENNVKPVIGCEFYYCDTYEENKYYHLILLAKNNKGYHNLLKLQYRAFMKGFYYKPRICLEDLKELSEGLICTTACIGSRLGQLINEDKYDEALKHLEQLFFIFENDLYLEVQPHEIDLQIKYNKFLLDVHRSLGIPLVVTSDAHYTTSDKADIHDTLLCIGSGKKKDDEERFRYTTKNAFNSEEKITDVFLRQGFKKKEIEECINNTKVITDMCNVSLECDEVFLPSLTEDDDYALAKLCNEKYVEKLKAGKFDGVDKNEVIKRIKYELKVLKEKGFSGYFLIVYDFLNWCTKNGIPIGPGRGSVGGSEVAFLLDIHRLEPIKHGFLFERFLNPTRMGYPDIDSDFCYERRNEVVDYVTKKYGKDYVSTVMAEGHMTTSLVIRKVMSAYGYESAVINRVSTKLVPKKLGITLQEAYDESPELKNFLDENANLKRDCFELENHISHFGKHAAGIIISSKPIYECVPVMRDEDNKQMMKTQWDKKVVEKQGLIKFDFLGLKLLTVYGYFIKNMKRLYNKDLTINDLYNIDLEDKNIYELLNNDSLLGIFQFSEYAGKMTIHNAKPQCFEDVMACESICRPGVKEAEKYIYNKQNNLYDETGIDIVDEILRPTYGTIIFQEQTLLILNKLGGFTLGEADKLRKVKSLEPYREKFITNATKKGYDKNKIEEVFNRFSLEYSFNKSHAGLYGVHSCLNAYLKHYYFTAYMSSYMTMEVLKDDKKSKIMDFIAECKNKGIKFVSPDINIATNEFIPLDENTIMLPFNFIKGLGDKAITMVNKLRPYKDIDDFLKRVPKRSINKTTLKKLIKAGSFDSFETNRQKLLIKYCGEPDMYWCKELKMIYEREVFNTNLSEHPLDEYINININNFENGKEASINAIITDVTIKLDRNSNTMAFLKCENTLCTFEAIVFASNYKIMQDLLVKNTKVNLTGKIDNGKILVNMLKLI